MKVLVIGATGFIGHAITQALLEEDIDVHALARETPPESSQHRRITYHRGDLGDPAQIAAAATGAEMVVHAAGIASPRAHARALKWIHVAGTENVANACVHAGVPRLLYLSCADVVLANTDRVHWDEKRALGHPPLGARAQTLQLAEEMALTAGGPKLAVTVLRPAWVWGPGDTSRLPFLAYEALNGGIRLFGNGRNLFASTYIDTLTRSVCAAVQKPSAAGRVYYISDAEFLEAREFFDMISQACGVSTAPRTTLSGAWTYHLSQIHPAFSGGFLPDEIVQRNRSTLFDVSAGIGALDFNPEIDIQAGMKALTEWVSAQGGAEAIAKLRKPALTASSVDTQVLKAGGE